MTGGGRRTGPRRPARPHVVVAGGGIAGVEALIALRELAGQRLSLELITPDPDLVMKPLAVAAPFGVGEVRRFDLERICADFGVHLRRERLEFVDVATHHVDTSGGARVPYDSLILAVGARARPAVPGAIVFDGEAGVPAMTRLLDDLRSGAVHSAAFVVPEGVTWALPLYELALMTAAALEGTEPHLTLVTPEHSPLALFGRPARERVRSLLADHGVRLVTGARDMRLSAGFLLSSAGAIPAERVLALPAIDGPRVPGVPCDPGGFLEVDDHGALLDAPDVYAAGDGTAHPIKQGGLATQQADAIAEAIASDAGAPCEAVPFRPELRAQLLTGTLPWFFRGGPADGHRARASRGALWAPAGKLAARYLTPYLADRHAFNLEGGERLRGVPATASSSEEERDAIRSLALVLADDEAEAGGFKQALRWLEIAEDTTGALPAGYAEKRRRWEAERPAAHRR